MRRSDQTHHAIAPSLVGSDAEIVAVLRVVPTDTAPRYAPQPAPTALLSGQVFPVTGDALTLGRDLQNNVVLLDPATSRTHALIERDATSYRVTNLSSQQPLQVDSTPLSPGECASLTPGATLQLGKTLLQWLKPTRSTPDESTVASTTLPPTLPRALSPGVTLQFAIRGRGRSGLWWALAAAGIIALLLGSIFTLTTAAIIGRQALGEAGIGRLWAAILLPLLPALTVGIVITLIDRYEREPLSLLSLAYIWGALIGVPFALFAERSIEATFTASSASGVFVQAISAGLLEEGVKGAGLVLLLLALRDQFDNVTDGVVYGLAIGAGFALVENFAYLAQSPSSAFPGLVLDRILLGWLGHSTFSALFGASLGYWRETHKRSGVWRAIGIGLALAAGLHTCFDAIVLAGSHIFPDGAVSRVSGLFILLAAYVPLFGAQAIILRITLSALGRETETIRAYLADEVLSGAVTPEEYVTVQNASIRLGVERHLLIDSGPRAYLLSYTLHQAIIGLAMRKWHVAAGDPRKSGAHQPENAYRERILVLRMALTEKIQARRG